MIYCGGNLIAEAGSTTYYRLTDHLGSLAVLTDGSGNPVETNVFVPYGEQLSGGAQDSFLYAGLEREPDTGTDRSLTRQYSSGQGRWLSPDLYHGSYDLNDPQSFNRYAYVRNSPHLLCRSQRTGRWRRRRWRDLRMRY
jgi:RHS repeat-associated protein